MTLPRAPESDKTALPLGFLITRFVYVNPPINHKCNYIYFNLEVEFIYSL